MENSGGLGSIESIVITAILSLLAAIITALLTTHLNHKNEVKRWILEQRAGCYFALYKELERILSDPCQIFEQSYFDVLITFKPQIKLLASDNTFEKFRAYYEYVRGNVRAYKKFCTENDPCCDPNREVSYTDENGDKHENWNITDEDIQSFEFAEKKYRKEHKPTPNDINKHLEPLYQAMRKDLGSRIKN